MPLTIEKVNSSWFHVPCVAHALHNCVMSSFKSNEQLQLLLTKCRSLVLFFHSSAKMTQVLMGSQKQDDEDAKPVAVILDVKTRWNSTLYMLRRLAILRNHIEAVPNQLERYFADNKSAEKLRNLLLRTSDWNQIATLIELLKPFEVLTHKFSSSRHGLAAHIGPETVGLLRELRATPPAVHDLPALARNAIEQFGSALKREVKARIQESKDFALSTALHPTYNNLWIYDQHQAFRDDVLARLRREYEEIFFNNRIPSSPSAPQQPVASFGSSELSTETPETGLKALLKRRRLDRENSETLDANESTIELNRYLALEVDDVDPYLWWRENREKFPTLAVLARKYLAVPATSVASERIFSYAGGIVTDNRNRLRDNAVSDIVFCHHAARCLS